MPKLPDEELLAISFKEGIGTTLPGPSSRRQLKHLDNSFIAVSSPPVAAFLSEGLAISFPKGNYGQIVLRFSNYWKYPAEILV